MNLEDLDVLLPPPPPAPPVVPLWVIVDATAPVRVRVPPATDPLPITPVNLAGALTVGTPVFAVLVGAQLIIVGAAGGTLPAGIADAITAASDTADDAASDAARALALLDGHGTITEKALATAFNTSTTEAEFLSLSFTAAAGQQWAAHLDIDASWSTTANVIVVARAFLDGTVQAGECIGSNGSATNLRAALSHRWRLPPLTAGTHTLSLRARTLSGSVGFGTTHTHALIERTT